VTCCLDARFTRQRIASNPDPPSYLHLSLDALSLPHNHLEPKTGCFLLVVMSLKAVSASWTLTLELADVCCPGDLDSCLVVKIVKCMRGFLGLIGGFISYCSYFYLLCSPLALWWLLCCRLCIRWNFVGWSRGHRHPTRPSSHVALSVCCTPRTPSTFPRTSENCIRGLTYSSPFPDNPRMLILVSLWDRRTP